MKKEYSKPSVFTVNILHNSLICATTGDPVEDLNTNVDIINGGSSANNTSGQIRVKEINIWDEEW